MLVHSEDSIAFVLTGGLTLYKLLKITHFLRHGGGSHFCIITIVQLFLPTSSLYITAGKSWYYYPLQKRNFPLHGAGYLKLYLQITTSLYCNMGILIFFVTKDIHGLFLQHTFLVQYCFLFSTRCYLSNVPAPASRVSQVPVSMYSLSPSPSFCISLTLFFGH